jgi:acetyl esterase/lipase/pectin methylesterase-like acyl-CoA thioesterase
MKNIFRLLVVTMGLFTTVRGQSLKGITNQRDTSYSNYNALMSTLKTHPNARLASDKPLENVTEKRAVEYAKIENRSLQLDVFYPKTKPSKPLPAVVIIHGGGWRTGNRTQHHALARRLASKGYVCFTPEYRLSTEALYPAAVHDLKAAVRWVRANAKKYQVNSSQIAAVGFSAGGQLAAFLGATNGLAQFEGKVGHPKESSRVEAVVDIDGVLAFIHPESGEGDDSKRPSAATYWFGYSKTENPALWQQASPLTHVSKQSPPYLFLNSGVDRMHAGREDFRQKLAAFGTYAEVQYFPKSPHSFILLEPWFEPSVVYISAYLAKVFDAQSKAKNPNKIIVSTDGSGDFRTIQGAIDHIVLADSTTKKPREIFIKNGTYHEKLMIDKQHFTTLKGESESGVIITNALPRDVWRCANPNDFGAATVNVLAHDLTFENVTILNTYGFDAKGDTTILCENESGTASAATKDRYALPREKGEAIGTKIVRKDGHQFAFRSMPGATRLIFKGVTFRAGGGDTVSPWDVESGMYYFKNCTMEGGVDFYCPRGWAWAENCRFICHNINAAIWHDGTNHESSKNVLVNCTFEGDKGYKLGRYHRPAQFFLKDCTFDENMADAEIYHVSSSPEPKWGHRVYFYNCHRKGGNDYDWHKDNLKISPQALSVQWTFEGQWLPK